MEGTAAMAHFVLTYIFTFKWMEKCVRKVIEMEIYHINPLYRIHQPSGWYGNEPKRFGKLDAFSCKSSFSSDKKMRPWSIITPGCRGRQIKKVETEARFYVILINGINALIWWNKKKWFGVNRGPRSFEVEFWPRNISADSDLLLLTNDFENKLLLL